MIRKFHPDKIPILLSRVKQSKLKDFDNNKYPLPHLGYSSSSHLPFSNSSWLSRKNYNSTTPRPFTCSPRTRCSTQNRPWTKSTISTQPRICSYTWATVNTPPSGTLLHCLPLSDPTTSLCHYRPSWSVLSIGRVTRRKKTSSQHSPLMQMIHQSGWVCCLLH